MPHVIVGTAGHIDHGKTALVKALTGIDADRLKEEKERGITIDIGFAHLALNSTTMIGFIDVPGHERFIKNMLAGVGGIDLVMLVIAADESVMPQTREHLDICSLLHIKQGVTVLTKIDKVETELVDVAEVEVREFLKGSFLENSPIVRVSSHTGAGIAELIQILRETLRTVGPKDENALFRLPIDRCFTMKGFGTVVTGALIGGRVQKEEEVEIFPSQRRARVRGIQVHGRSAPEARAGQRTALNLQGVDVSEVQRGMVLATPGLLQPASMLDCHLELLSSAPKPVESRKRIRFHTGTAELMGYVVLLGQEKLQPGHSSFAQIRLEEPTLALPGDRFIIRQYSPMITIGGGEILDAIPEKHRTTDTSVLESLRVLKEGAIDDRIITIVQQRGMETIDLPQLAARLGEPPNRVHQRIDILTAAGRLRRVGESPVCVVSTTAFRQAQDAILDAVTRFHQTKPLVLGMSREELKERVFREASNLLFQAVLEQLSSDKKITIAQDLIHVFGRKITLNTDEQRLRTQIAERFRSLGLQAASADEVIDALKLDRITARKIIQLMVKENQLIKVTEQMLIDRPAIEKLIADVKGLKATNPRFGVTEFKNLTGVTRKHAIPLLEYLDRQRVTRRVGDNRLIL
jgi:selenocysteine-specific elongation factor